VYRRLWQGQPVSEDGRDTAGVTTRLIVAYTRRHLGETGVSELLRHAGETRPVEVLEDESMWSSYRQKIALFDAAERLTGDPWVARRIGESVLIEQLGAIVRIVVGALGSPQQVLRSVARANVKFSTSATMATISSAPGHAVVSYRLHDEHTPSRHDCRYTQGILTQATVLFGLPPARITHPHCQVDGADECVYELTWPRWRWWSRILTWRWRGGMAAESLRDQVAELERTVADLVATDDLDSVLTKIATRASAAVHAQRHLLVVRVGDRVTIKADGLDDEVAGALGRELLAHGNVDLPDEVLLVAPIASSRRTYGWLAAFLPADAGFLPVEQEHLEAYSGLAAAALDVTTSLDAVRHTSEVNAALLRLSRQLAHEADERAIATRVAEAAPIVVGSHQASVLLWDDAANAMVTVATVGYDELTAAARDFTVPADATPVLTTIFADPTPQRFERGRVDHFVDAALERFDQEAVTVGPIVVNDAVVGLVLASEVRGTGSNGDRSSQLAAVAGLADQAGIAIDRLRLLSSAVHAANHDQLTGLPGRGLFNDRLERALTDIRRSERIAAVFFIDLDGFKAVNDTYGHAAGDAVLREVADRLRGSVRAGDSVARMSGDEFAVLLRDLPEEDVAIRSARKLVTVLGRVYDLGEVSCRLGASLGVAVAPRHGETPEELLRAADTAMYRAKRVGGSHRVADPLDVMH
jgi:diguanylate cyclase (GGDEF)-like protein